jgi:hypothetical protein
MLNAAVAYPPSGPGPDGSKWSEQFVVNFLCKHLLGSYKGADGNHWMLTHWILTERMLTHRVLL